jgi:hypothetical protein
MKQSGSAWDSLVRSRDPGRSFVDVFASADASHEVTRHNDGRCNSEAGRRLLPVRAALVTLLTS